MYHPLYLKYLRCAGEAEVHCRFDVTADDGAEERSAVLVLAVPCFGIYGLNPDEAGEWEYLT